MDLIGLIVMLAPSIIYCTLRKPIRNNYKLIKDYKKGCNINITSPITITSDFTEIDKNILTQEQFEKKISNFIKIINEQITGVNQPLLLNNLNSLKFVVKESFLYLYDTDNNKTTGQYYIGQNTILLSKLANEFTIYHELLHAISSFFDNKNNIYYSGFKQVNNKKERIGSALNEGYTQYLTEKYFKDNTKIAYVYECLVAKLMENVVGEEEMQSLYFNANLYGLVECLKQYATEEEIYKFINTLDFVSNHKSDKYLIPNYKKLITEGFKYTNYFILKINLRKSMIINKKSTNKIAEELTAIITKLPEKIECGKNIYKIPIEHILDDVLDSITQKDNNKEERTITEPYQHNNILTKKREKCVLN